MNTKMTSPVERLLEGIMSPDIYACMLVFSYKQI